MDFKLHKVSLSCNIHPDKSLMTANLFAGPCPNGCLYCYARSMRPNIFYEIPKFVNIDSIDSIKHWPDYLFLSSYSEPFLPKVLNLTYEIVNKAFAHNTFVSFSTKCYPNEHILKLLKENNQKTSVSISLTSINDERNKILEPGAPTASERLNLAKVLIEMGVSTWIKVDTIFPDIDDKDEAIEYLIKDVRKSGIEKILFSYVFYRPQWRKRLDVPFLKDSFKMLSEKQSIASGTGFSLPLYEKKQRLKKIGEIARQHGFSQIVTCGCKNPIDPVDIGFDSSVCEFHWK